MLWPFRGHDEAVIFLECMKLLKMFDLFLQSFSAPSHSPCERPSRRLKEAGMFSIMADEARDGNTEQLATCVRY